MTKAEEIYYRSLRLPLEEAVPAAQAVQAVWELRRGDRPMPARREIDPWDLRAFLGLISLVEVVQEPFDLICRLDGTTIAFASNEDQTNRSLRDGTPALVYAGIFDDIAAAVEDAAPGLRLVENAFGGHRFRYQRLALPYGEGKRPDWLLLYTHSLDDPRGRFRSIR